jgi:hypothetical protein
MDIDAIIEEAFRLKNAHDGMHNMHGHCAAIVNSKQLHEMNGNPIDEALVERLITNMRIAAATGKFPPSDRRKKQ